MKLASYFAVLFAMATTEAITAADVSVSKMDAPAAVDGKVPERRRYLRYTSIKDYFMKKTADADEHPSSSSSSSLKHPSSKKSPSKKSPSKKSPSKKSPSKDSPSKDSPSKKSPKKKKSPSEDSASGKH